MISHSPSKRRTHLRKLGICFCTAIALLLPGVGNGQTLFQLVESVPVETSLGIEETARTLPVWLEMIHSARHSLDMEIFYLSHEPDEALTPALQALQEAAARGVRVRILVDERFYHTYPETLDKLDSLSGIEVRTIGYFNRLGGVQHAKYFVVDGEELFLGSQNWDWRALKHIHELGVRVRHPGLARLLRKIFELDWQLAASNATEVPDLPPLPPEEIIDAQHPVRIPWQGDTLRIYPTFSPVDLIYPGMVNDEQALLSLMNAAEERLSAQLLTYNPAHQGKLYLPLDNAMRQAAARGTAVQLLVSDWNKRAPGVFYLQSLAVLPDLEVKFSTIPPYSGGFIPYARVEHCKYLLQDQDLCWIGTANWGWSYFYASRNVGLVIKSPRVNQIVDKVFSRSWTGPYSYPVDPCAHYQPPRIAR